MGLDMYLDKSFAVGGKYRVKRGQEDRELNFGKDPLMYDGRADELVLPLSEIKEVTVEVAYWRKANHIHQWFVENVQDGEDDCRPYYVETDKLRELLATCEKVLENHDLAEELLPTRAGFFFGSTEYDEYYFEAVKYTADALREELNGVPDGDMWRYGFYHYTYRSSW